MPCRGHDLVPPYGEPLPTSSIPPANLKLSISSFNPGMRKQLLGEESSVFKTKTQPESERLRVLGHPPTENFPWDCGWALVAQWEMSRGSRLSPSFPPGAEMGALLSPRTSVP